MLIKVIYQNDKHDMVKPMMLNTLLLANRIKQFHRSEGWVTIGVDKIRGTGGCYEGSDRRRNVTELLSAE